MENVRQATIADLSRIAEIVIFNYRLNFYPIFQNDDYYFNELQVSKVAKQYEDVVGNMWVYDDGAIKGVIQIENSEIKKLFVEPALQGKSIGSYLLKYAIVEHKANTLWALEKNVRAIRFYKRHGFNVTTDKKLEEDTTEYLVRLKR
jgi:putative acetyltransferase